VDSLWLKRWNTLKNYAQEQIDKDTLGDIDYYGFKNMLELMAQIEEMEETV